ncbi:MAG TPA: choice-of-anchor D domain-containing protein [Candidatus Acidoferrum sp.]|nr:choice-of-anchor D domain-containing protein [Candidatus Acidoferrum sp.]
MTTGAYATSYTSPVSDGFLAIIQPSATPALTYCTYLGLNGQIGVGGIVVDTSGNAYIAGSTSDPNADFPLKNAAQPFFGGGAFDAFVMKIAPTGNGAQDLVYATLLGGNNSDKAFAVTLDSANPPNAYVTGTTSSTNFPTNATVAPYQAALPSNATSLTSDAFVSVIAQNATTGATSLAYSSYLGGSQTDAGYGIEAAQPYAVFVAGTANSWDFPWRDNFQPFNGYGNAFVVKLDTTTPGTAGLIYSTPLGGTSPAGVQAGTQASGIAVIPAGTAGCEPADATSDCVWVTGQTTSADFANAGNPGNGLQQICASCQESTVTSDALVAEIQENATQQLPSLYFAGPGIPLNFGTQAIGATNAPLQFAAIKNGGEATLNVANIGIIGPNSNDFALSNWTSCENASISPGGLCSFEVGFVPSIAGAEEAFVQVTSNAPGSPQVLEVVGTGAGLGALPGSLKFAQQVVGAMSAPQSVTLTNTSSVQLFIDSIAEGGADPAMFVFASNAQQCVASAAAILQEASCLVDMTFDPTTAGTFTAEVDIQYHLSGEAEQQQTITLSGTAVAAAPVAVVLPATLNFGTVTIGQTSATQIVTLFNTGNVALDMTGFNLTGTNASDFAIVNAGSAPCPTGNGTVAMNASCTVRVQFAPQTAGIKSATLSFADDAVGSPQTMALAGTAPAPAAIQITPTALTFASQAVGTKSTAQLVTIANTGGTALAVNGISLSGTNAGDFTETNNCPPSLAANANCATSIVFEPTAPGTRNASLTVADNGGGSPQQIGLSGTATQAGVTLSTSSINFGNEAVGVASAAITVTVTNSGNGPLVISALALSGANASDFSETDNCSGTGTGVAAGGTCAIQIVFKPECGPVASATRVATLSLADDAPGSPQTVAVTGTGTGPFCFMVPSGASTSASVLPGETGTFALQAEAANAFTGNVNLACVGAPANSTCTIAPTTVNIGGSEIAALQVSIATSAGTTNSFTSPRGRPNGAPHGLQLYGWALLALLSTLILLVACLQIYWKEKPHDERRLAPMHRFGLIGFGATLCVAFVVSSMIVGCGGGGSAPASTDPPTPAGTYTLTVSGTTSSGASQSITLTLTVQ